MKIDCDELCLKGMSKFQIEKDSLVNDGKNKNAIYVKSKFKEENNNNDIIWNICYIIKNLLFF